MFKTISAFSILALTQALETETAAKAEVEVTTQAKTETETTTEVAAATEVETKVEAEADCPACGNDRCHGDECRRSRSGYGSRGSRGDIVCRDGKCREVGYRPSRDIVCRDGKCREVGYGSPYGDIRCRDGKCSPSYGKSEYRCRTGLCGMGPCKCEAKKYASKDCGCHGDKKLVVGDDRCPIKRAANGRCPIKSRDAKVYSTRSLSHSRCPVASKWESGSSSGKLSCSKSGCGSGKCCGKSSCGKTGCGSGKCCGKSSCGKTGCGSGKCCGKSGCSKSQSHVLRGGYGYRGKTGYGSRDRRSYGYGKRDGYRGYGELRRAEVKPVLSKRSNVSRSAYRKPTRSNPYERRAPVPSFGGLFDHGDVSRSYGAPRTYSRW